MKCSYYNLRSTYLLAMLRILGYIYEKLKLWNPLLTYFMTPLNIAFYFVVHVVEIMFSIEQYYIGQIIWYLGSVDVIFYNVTVTILYTVAYLKNKKNLWKNFTPEVCLNNVNILYYIL